MGYRLTPYSIILLLTVVLSGFIIIFIRKTHIEKQSRILQMAILSGMEFSLFLGLENLVTGFQQKVLFAKISYLGIYSCVPFFLWFTLLYTRKEYYVTKNRVIALFVIPVFLNILAWTNEYHHLLWSGFVYSSNPNSNLLIYLRGPLYWFGVAYNYLLFIFIFIFLISDIFLTQGIIRRQSITLLLGSLPVILANVIYLAASGSLRGYDLSPIGFALMGLIFFIGIKRYRMLTFFPVRPSAILDGIQDGIVVLDQQDTIIDYNPAANQYIQGGRDKVIGTQVQTGLNNYPGLLSKLTSEENFGYEIFLDSDNSRVVFVECRKIQDTHQNGYNRLLTFQDITIRKQVEGKEKEQRELAEAYRDVLVALTSTLEFDKVLDLIMENIHKVMPYGMTNLVLIDPDGIGRVARCIGYENKSVLEWVKTVEFHMDKVRTYQIMMETGKPLIVHDTHKADYWLYKQNNIHSYLGAPILIKGHTLGFINQDHSDPDFYNEEQAERLQAFADLAAIALENARLFKLTEEMAIVDGLTGLFNRRHFFQLTANEVKRSIRFDTPCSLVIFDIDNFKDINDLYGHPFGDKVLKDVTKTLMECVREIDICGRYGGDEFCILLPETDLEGAKNLTERVLETFRTLVVSGSVFTAKITASFGLAALDANTQTVDDLLSHADFALYQAKQRGRDRIEVWNENIPK
jgi:diguanylate cyclase (GGDEF)-like protein